MARSGRSLLAVLVDSLYRGGAGGGSGRVRSIWFALQRYGCGYNYGYGVKGGATWQSENRRFETDHLLEASLGMAASTGVMGHASLLEGAAAKLVPRMVIS